jgi:HlyD family secretion protein
MTMLAWNHRGLRRGAAVVLLISLVLALCGCAAVSALPGKIAAPEANAAPAAAATAPVAPTAAPTPAPVVLSTPSGSASNKRLDAASLTYNGEVIPDTIVPVVSQVAGQIQEVKVKVGDDVHKGDLLVRTDSSVLEAQHDQALAALQLAQSQLDLAKTPPKASDLAAAQAAISAAQAAYDRAVKGPTDEEKRMALAQLKQAEAAMNLYQSQYDRIASDPFAAMKPEALQLQQATLAHEAAQASYDKMMKGATADAIAGAYAQLQNALATLARLQRGAEPAQIRAAEAGVKQAEVAVYLSQLQLDKAAITAPVDGFIYRLDAVEGGMAGLGASMAVVYSHPVKILIPVEESRAESVRVGQPATIKVDAFPGRTFPGKITEIAPSFDRSTRTIQVTVRPDGDGTDLKPGMFATVQLVEQ